MDLTNLLDPTSLAIVIVGTLAATVLRSGLGDCARTFGALGSLGRKRFDADRVRSELAIQVQEIKTDGILRAAPHEMGDSEFDEVSGTLAERRSISALLEAHEQHKSRRLALDNAAVRTLAQAAELAPVFGLAGTLYALAQLPRTGISGADYAATISMAVLTTLYGLLFANLVLAPLSCILDRRATSEEAERQKVLDWLAVQVAAAMSPPRRTEQAKPAAGREAA
jgi:chemotaxis protein MotA